MILCRVVKRQSLEEPLLLTAREKIDSLAKYASLKTSLFSLDQTGAERGRAIANKKRYGLESRHRLVCKCKN